MLRVRPERFIAGGEVLARDDDGRVLFVGGALPGEDVTVTLSDERNDYAKGFVTEIHETSPNRVEPPCKRRHEGCGGCNWQHLAVDAQLSAKADIVVDALRRTGRLPNAVVTVGASISPDGYRTTVRVIGDEFGKASFRRERSHDTVEASGCLVAHPAIEAILDDLLVTPALEVSIRTSVATGEMTVHWDESLGDVVGLPHDVRIGLTGALTEHVAGHRFRVSSGSFFQSGPTAAELLVDAVKRAAPELADAESVVDAYAGVGLFAVAAVPEAAHVIAVESSKLSVTDCRANLKGRQFRIDLCEVGRWRLEPGRFVDVVIADPSRTGLGKPGVGALAAAKSPILIVVSCDPVALARDAALLAAKGYEHRSTEVLDLFPHTHHVEAVTRFVAT
jgi:23S rRNA (uracil1939-C5)-methyltransferase